VDAAGLDRSLLRQIPKQDATCDPPAGLARKRREPKKLGGTGQRAPKALPKKPALPLSRKRSPRTNRVFVRLPKDSALRTVHLLFVAKTVNSPLPSGKEVETASSVRTGIAVTPKSGTTADDLLQSKERITKALGGGRIEADERWDSLELRL
jgi:hypothetical protein